jgi:hypothetical protein
MVIMNDHPYLLVFCINFVSQLVILNYVLLLNYVILYFIVVFTWLHIVFDQALKSCRARCILPHLVSTG